MFNGDNVTMPVQVIKSVKIKETNKVYGVTDRMFFCAHQCFITMQALLPEWRIGIPEYCEDSGASLVSIIRYTSRQFYGASHGHTNRVTKSGLYSSAGLKLKNTKGRSVSWDHCRSPQTMGEYIMDYSNIFLNNFDKFLELYVLGCEVHGLSPDENNALIKLKHSVPTHDKYKALGIDLYDVNGKEHDNTIWMPKDFIEWEARVVLTNDN